MTLGYDAQDNSAARYDKVYNRQNAINPGHDTLHCAPTVHPVPGVRLAHPLPGCQGLSLPLATGIFGQQPKWKLRTATA